MTHGAVDTAGAAARDVPRYRLPLYFALAYAVSWTLWAPLVAGSQGWIGWSAPEWWHYAGAAGPITAATVVTATAAGRAGLRGLFGQLDPRRARPGWVIFALGSPAALFLAGAVAARLAGDPWPALPEVGRTGNLPELGLALTWLVHLGTFGLGEETGWRGFALPELESKRSALRATLILWALWGLWHLPTFVYSENMRGLGASGTVGWGIGLLAGAVFLAWLYHGGGLLTVVLWHGTFNTLVASEAAEGLIAAVITTGVMLAAVVILATGRLEPRVRPAGRSP